MDLEEIQKQVDAWLEGTKQGRYLQQTIGIVQCQLLLLIIKRLDDIDGNLSSMSQDSWNDHHNR